MVSLLLERDRIGLTAETGRYISSVNTVNTIIIIKGADIIILDFFPVKVVNSI